MKGLTVEDMDVILKAQRAEYSRRLVLALDTPHRIKWHKSMVGKHVILVGEKCARPFLVKTLHRAESLHRDELLGGFTMYREATPHEVVEKKIWALKDKKKKKKPRNEKK